MSTIKVDWNKLAKIEELKEYFEEDFSDFQKLTEQYISQIIDFSQEDLDRMAELRVLEVTNGCVQWGFRRKDKQSLSVEQTRECMRKVIGFIKEKKIYFPSRGMIILNPRLQDFSEEVRQLYLDGFKNKVPEARRKFYATSTAQFIVCGSRRLEAAMELVKQDYEDFFSPYFIQRGRNYIAPYLACVE